ncbi:MAG TPA: DNA modification methylase [Candidatus Paceibacterota bacterium]|nr:DNA modification methylase [Candidatus Paceibacterota bacterium]
MSNQDSHALNLAYVRINELKSNEYNPRIHTKEAVIQLKRSIGEHSIVDPIIINTHPSRANIIIGGEMRWKACKELGYKEVPVIKLSIADLEKEKALCLRLNAISGEWSEELLKEFEEEFLLDSGFEPDELEFLYGDLEVDEDDFSTKKALEQIKKPKSKLGDLYQLGSHFLYCGDSTDIESVKKVVGEHKMDMIYNDPIYNIALSYEKGVGGTKNYGGSVKDSMSDVEYEAFLKKTMENALSVSNKDAHIFYYSDQRYASLVQKLYGELGIDFKRTCIWLKGIANPTPNVAFSKIYEPVTYGVRGKPFLNKSYHNFNEIMNKETTNGHRVIDEFYDMIDVWAVNRLSGNEYEHPTEKPVTLHEKAIKRCTKVGDNILSLFGGSGGELICAEQLNRRVFMVEIDPVFIDLIIMRYEHYTKNKAIKLN